MFPAYWSIDLLPLVTVILSSITIQIIIGSVSCNIHFNDLHQGNIDNIHVFCLNVFFLWSKLEIKFLKKKFRFQNDIHVRTNRLHYMMDFDLKLIQISIQSMNDI